MEDYNKEQWWIELQEAMKGFDEKSTNKFTDGRLAQWNAGKNNKGIKHTDFTKQKFSQAKIGTIRSIESVKKSNDGIKETKWKKTLSMVSLDDIITAQQKHGNHQTNTINELGISYGVYKKLCAHYGIEKKKSLLEKSEWARTTQSKAILVYSENNELVGEYYSVNNVCKELNLHKGNMLTNMKKNRLYKGYYFKYKDTI